MSKLWLFALLWALYLICSTTVVVNAILWLPAQLLGIGCGVLIIGILLFTLTVALDMSLSLDKENHG